MLVRDDGSICRHHWRRLRGSRGLGSGARGHEEEKPQTLHFNLNNNPKYDTGLVCGGTLEVFSSRCCRLLLYIFGAGHVAWSLYKVARIAGLRRGRHRRPRKLCQPRALP